MCVCGNRLNDDAIIIISSIALVGVCVFVLFVTE